MTTPGYIMLFLFLWSGSIILILLMLASLVYLQTRRFTLPYKATLNPLLRVVATVSGIMSLIVTILIVVMQ